MITSLPLFSSLNANELSWLASRLHCRTFSPETNIITAEEPGDVVFFILSGTVKVHIEQASGADVVLAILGTGDIVGEMSLLDSAGRSASVQTLEESTVLWMNRENFQAAVRTIPVLAINLVQALAARVRLANEHIQTLATLDVYGRVARQLLAFADKYGEESGDGQVRIPIRLTQGEIADLVGASRKRVNQVMVAFKNSGYISLGQRGQLSVLDRAALAKRC
jgi:CRP/FNR family cyclic AMP-dependent transcriptional regulator